MSSVSYYHLFSLPSELLDSLVPRNLAYDRNSPAIEEDLESVDEHISNPASQRTCNICQGVNFADVNQQRAHFRSDLHRYNVKTRLRGGKVVSEAEFANLIEGLEESLSGSASSSEDDDGSESDAVGALLAKTRLKSRSSSPVDRRQAPLTAVTWFHAFPSTQLGVYRAIFTPHPEENSYLPELRSLQTPIPEGRKWAMFMVAGGHFAGVVVRVSRPSIVLDQTKGKQKKPAPEMEILRHKTFHRYTTRRKQGGSQSLNDNAKGNAKSAGALLRRYGEQALREDIRALLEEWADDISHCERIWLRASGSNKKIFIDYDQAIIHKADSRLRSFPFPTRRPTQAELSRCLMELTKPKVTHFTEEELQAQDDAYLASLPKPRPQARPATPQTKATEKKVEKMPKEEEVIRDKWLRLLDMVKKGRLEPLRSFWEREREAFGGVNTSLPEWTGEKAATLLQIASIHNQAEVTSWLLNDLHADPTIPFPSKAAGDEDGVASDTSEGPVGARKSTKTAYDVAASGTVRDSFRRSAAQNPDLWDWFGAAHLPSALTKEREEERDSKKKERRKGLKDKIKSRESRTKDVSLVEEPLDIPAAQSNSATAGPQKLGGAAGSTEGLVGLTPEMRAKIERERRRRAAEARMKGHG